MRWWLALIVLAGPAAADGIKSRSSIDVAYDAQHLDLDKHVLQFKPSRAIQDASLVVIGEDGAQLATAAATYDGKPAPGWLSISWEQPAAAKVMVLELRVSAKDGAATKVQLIPWSVTVEHEDVSFRSDSAVVDADEAAKLDASLAKIADIAKKAEPYMKLQLYVAGHTDTVGPAAKNKKLSLDRAMAIGAYLRGKKLAIAIAVAGYGEEVLKVKTPDETDERANRRADYVLGPAGGAPPFKAKAVWRPLK